VREYEDGLIVAQIVYQDPSPREGFQGVRAEIRTGRSIRKNRDKTHIRCAPWNADLHMVRSYKIEQTHEETAEIREMASVNMGFVFVGFGGAKPTGRRL